MNVTQILFSGNGRLRRRDYWLWSIGVNIVSSVLGLVVALLMGFGFDSDGYDIVSGVVSLVFLWPSIAIMVKRCHDRDKSWPWVLLFILVPIVGWIWGFIELGFLDGTQGPNRFGPSPKGLGGEGGYETAEVFS